MVIEICCMNMLEALIDKNINIMVELIGDDIQYMRPGKEAYINVNTCPFCGAKL